MKRCDRCLATQSAPARVDLLKEWGQAHPKFHRVSRHEHHLCPECFTDLTAQLKVFLDRFNRDGDRPEEDAA